MEKTITSLGIGEALVTVLSPRGVPTPLAATRLIPPDSLMAALPPADLPGQVASGLARAKYGDAVDRESAHEIITARIAAAQAAAAEMAAQRLPSSRRQPDHVRWSEHDDPGPAAAGDRATGASNGRAGRGPLSVSARPRCAGRRRSSGSARPMPDGGTARSRGAIRTGGRVLTSRAGQDIIRGVFGTLFSGKR